MSSPLQRLRGFGLPPRIVGLDVARGIAVLGMVAAHTAELPGVLIWNDPATWIELVNGRSSMLFGVLAGVSIALMTGRGVVPEGPRLARMRLRLVARGIVIFAIGIALELLGTTIAVILTFYGAVYAVAILFVGMRVRTLLIWAACLALAGPALSSTLLALGVSTWGGGVGFVLGGAYSIVAWTALMLVGLVLGRLDITRRRTAALGLAVGVALSSIGYTAGAIWESQQHDTGRRSWSAVSSDGDSSTGAYTADTVPAGQADLEGKVCEDSGDGFLHCFPEGASGVESGVESGGSDDQGSGSVAEGSGWAAYPERIAEADLGGTALRAGFSSSPHSGATMEILGSGGLALAVICLLLLCGNALRYALLPLAAVGSMPLTAYSAHVIVIWIVLGPGGMNTLPFFTAALIAGLLVACTAWAILVGRGPLERLTARAAQRMAPPTTTGGIPSPHEAPAAPSPRAPAPQRAD